MEYIIHGTQLENLEQILKSKELQTNPKAKYRMLDKKYYNPKQIFTQIIYKNMPNQNNQKPQLCFLLPIYTQHRNVLSFLRIGRFPKGRQLLFLV